MAYSSSQSFSGTTGPAIRPPIRIKPGGGGGVGVSLLFVVSHFEGVSPIESIAFLRYKWMKMHLALAAAERFTAPPELRFASRNARSAASSAR